MSPFRVYATMDARMPLSGVAACARRAEAMGYDGLNVPDSVHDALAAATRALQATTRFPMPSHPACDSDAARVIGELRGA